MLLAFAGVKLIASETPIGKLPIPLTLSVIVVTLSGSIAWSLPAPATGPRTPPTQHRWHRRTTGNDAERADLV